MLFIWSKKKKGVNLSNSFNTSWSQVTSAWHPTRQDINHKTICNHRACGHVVTKTKKIITSTDRNYRTPQPNGNGQWNREFLEIKTPGTHIFAHDRAVFRFHVSGWERFRHQGFVGGVYIRIKPSWKMWRRIGHVFVDLCGIDRKWIEYVIGEGMPADVSCWV